MKGLRCSIYQNPSGNFSAAGISSRVCQITLVGEGIDGVFEPSDDAPAVHLCRRQLTEDREHVFAKPVELGSSHSMMGGCFIWTSDGRFPANYPIPLHDRVEP
jgi:hypothetical protein